MLSSIRKWRPQCKAVKYSVHASEFYDKSLYDSVLRFNPIQVAEWLQQLLAGKEVFSHKALSLELGVDRTRVQQFLSLFRIPVNSRVRLKDFQGFPRISTGTVTY